MTEVFSNALNAGTFATLDARVQPSDLSIQVSNPAADDLQQGEFRIIVIDPISGDREYMLVTSGQQFRTWNVQRAVDSSVALSFPAGSVVRHVLTKDALIAIINQITSSGGPVKVDGKFDGVQITDAAISAGNLNQVTSPQAQWGNWHIGKRIALSKGGPSGYGFAATIQSFTGDIATIDTPAVSPMTGATAVIGTDDTQAWLDALASLATGIGVGHGRSLAAPAGFSLFGAELFVPEMCQIRGDGKFATNLIALTANARVRYGPPFVGGTSAQPNHTALNEGFLVNAMFIANNPLFINAVNGTFNDVGAMFGVVDNVICGGQNCTFENLDSAGAAQGGCLVLDNGCGGYCFYKPELNAAGYFHLIIRSSQSAEGIGYGVPQYNYFEDGICEGRNFVLAGDPGEGNVLITAGRFNTFKDMNFYIDGFTGGRESMVLIRGFSTGVTNPDGNYWVNGDHVFRDCTWTGPGGTTRVGNGIEADNVDTSGAAQVFPSVIVPYELDGYTQFNGLAVAEKIGTLLPPRRRGKVFYS